MLASAGDKLIPMILRGFGLEEVEVAMAPFLCRLVDCSQGAQARNDRIPPLVFFVANGLGPQAYVIGRSLGLQFHPEVTPEIMESWVKAYRHELDGDGVDPDALLEETHRLAPEVRPRSERLFNRFVTAIARVVPEGARGR